VEFGPDGPNTESGAEFVLPRRKAVTEANWHVWQAEGIRPVPPYEALSDDRLTEALRLVQNVAGIENVWTGDAFDLREGRPLAGKPGTGIYATEDGIDRLVQRASDFWLFPERD
jgi:hypothetical protein